MSADQSKFMKQFGLAPEGGDSEKDKEMLLEEEVALMAMQSDMKRRFNYNRPTNNSFDSDNSKPIGTKRKFKEIREGQVDSEVNKLLIEFAIDITVLLIIVILLLVD